MFKKMVILIALLTMVGMVPKANALMLSFDDGTTYFEVADNAAVDNDGTAYDGLLDANPTLGVVSFSGLVGVWDVLNSAAGASAPANSAVTSPEIHLNTFQVSSTATGTMTVRLTDTFGALDDIIDGYTALVGGVAGGTVTTNYYLDGVKVASLGPFSGAFSGQQVFMDDFAAPNEFTIEAIISHDGGFNSTSVDSQLTPVPEPGTLLLLGGGLVGLAYLRKRKKA